MLNIDFHIHTKYSFDSFMDINKIVKISQQKNLSGIAICDHDYFSFPKLEKELKRTDDDFFMIPGMEIKTDMGDLIGIMITDTIDSNNFFECIDEIKAQGGISILPHPYRRKKDVDVDNIAKSVDWIEVNNSRSTKEQNNHSIELSKRIKKPKIAGSDAHLYSEIGTSYVTVKDIGTIEELINEISRKNVKIISRVSSKKVHYWSSIIGVLKTRRFGEFFKGVKKEIKR